MLIAACLAAAVPATAAAQASEQANRQAYVYAMRCFATAAGVQTDPRSTPAEKAAADASFESAYNAAIRMGRLLGLSGRRIEDDMASTVRVEAALQLRDAAYYLRTQAECRQLGL